jgi:hypothetical protein
MKTTVCQRWREKRDTYRPAGEVIPTRQYEVAEIAGKGSDTIARTFVCTHHYSGSYPAAVRRFGLYRRDKIVGVAVYTMPRQPQLTRLGVPWTNRETLELARFVLLDDVEANGETWFLARTFRLLRQDGWVSMLSYADPAPRTSAAGRTTFGGHIGTIYQAHNAAYLGRSVGRVIHLLPDGSVLSDAVQSKIRLGKKGWQYGVRNLVAMGAPEPAKGEDMRLWLGRQRRSLRHPGTHTYLWALDKRARRHLPDSGAYPKFDCESQPGGADHGR